MTYGHGQRIGLHVLAEKAARSQCHHVGQQSLVMKEMSLGAESLAPWLQKVLGNHGHGKAHIRAVKNLGNAITVNLGYIMALTDQEAFLECIDGVAVVSHLGVVRHHDEGNAAGMAESAEIFHDQPAGALIQSACRFVGHEDARVIYHGSGNGHTLLLTARKTVARVMHARGEPNKLQRPDDAGPALGRRNLLINEREFDVLEDGGVIEKVAGLHDEAQVAAPEGGGLLAVESQDVLVHDGQRSGIRRVQESQNMEHGGLAAAGWSHDGHQLAGVNFQVHTTENGSEAGVTLVQILGDNDRFHVLSLFEAQSRDDVHAAGLHSGEDTACDADERGEKNGADAAQHELQDGQRRAEHVHADQNAGDAEHDADKAAGHGLAQSLAEELGQNIAVGTAHGLFQADFTGSGAHGRESAVPDAETTQHAAMPSQRRTCTHMNVT